MNQSFFSVRLLKASFCEIFFRKRWNSSTPQNFKDFLKSWEVKLQESQVPDAEISVKIIASHVLQIDKLDKLIDYSSQYPTVDQKNCINRGCECRLARVPVQYIIQEWNFRNITLKMMPPVFIPRPETESLIDIIKQNVEPLNHALEIGCGSGAISISLLNENENLKMTVLDQSELACNLTRTNAILNNVDNRLVIHHKKLQDDGGIDDFNLNELDAIISNPPYVFTSELRELEPEVKLYEDLRALDGGLDGLRVIKGILKYSAHTLLRGKNCFLEIHHKHVPLIEKWLSENINLNIQITKTFKDLFGYDRFVCVTKIR